MKPLVVLITVFLVTLTVSKLRGKLNIAFSGVLAMSMMLVFTAIGHFAFPEGMSLMIPPFIPFKVELVVITGVIELVAAIILLIPRHRIKVSWLLIVFFLLILPVNIYAALHHVDYQKATFDGPGPDYLWFRVPLQLLFIAWLYYFAIKSAKQS